MKNGPFTKIRQKALKKKYFSVGILERIGPLSFISQNPLSLKLCFFKNIAELNVSKRYVYSHAVFYLKSKSITSSSTMSTEIVCFICFLRRNFLFFVFFFLVFFSFLRKKLLILLFFLRFRRFLNFFRLLFFPCFFSIFTNFTLEFSEYLKLFFEKKKFFN